MKHLVLIWFLIATIGASAQNRLTISGKVIGQNQRPLAAATVFIASTQYVTQTDSAGNFEIQVSHTGAYHLLVKMLGYDAGGEDIVLKDNLAGIVIKLNIKPIVLNQVNIGSDKYRTKNYAIFKREFLGTTFNGGSCVILNPEIINFSTRNGQLYADADDFLIIENKRLGYRIKYLLRSFRHMQNTVNTAYNGDAYYEDLAGTDTEKQEWAKNRFDAYRGSMMHFFRAVFNHRVMEEGFVANNISTTQYTSIRIDGQGTDENQDNLRQRDEQPIDFNKIAFPIDSSFISLRFKDMYVTYNPKKIARLIKHSSAPAKKGESIFDKNAALLDKAPVYKSELLLPNKLEAIIDARGSIPSGYLLTFLVLGDWINQRVGDQLPFEYQPPIKTAITP